MFRRPLKLIYYEYFVNQKDAKARERFLKSGFGRSQFKLALKNSLEKLGYLPVWKIEAESVPVTVDTQRQYLK